jgi:hypothetical protein
MVKVLKDGSGRFVRPVVSTALVNVVKITLMSGVHFGTHYAPSEHNVPLFARNME